MRPHVHVNCPDGEAKFWITPTVALAHNQGLSEKQTHELAKLVEEHRDEIDKAWKSTSVAEVSNISAHGFWLLIGEREYFLPFDVHPWFREAKVSQILNVDLLHGQHLHWPDLDIDIELNSLIEPEKYPLIYT